MTERGILICGEGGEGSGKTTILEAMADRMENTVYVNDPNSYLGSCKKIREIVLSDYSLEPTSDLLLYTAARAELVHKLILPALNTGTNVLCDRFLYSTIVYQGHIRGQNIDLIKKMHNIFCYGIMPDITILFDVDAKIGLERSRKRLDDGNIDEGRWENETLDTHRNINGFYKLLISQDKREFIMLDVNKKSIDELIDEAIFRLNSALSKRGCV